MEMFMWCLLGLVVGEESYSRDYETSNYTDRLGLLAATIVLSTFSFLFSRSLPFHFPPFQFLIELSFLSFHVCRNLA